MIKKSFCFKDFSYCNYKNAYFVKLNICIILTPDRWDLCNIKCQWSAFWALYYTFTRLSFFSMGWAGQLCFLVLDVTMPLSLHITYTFQNENEGKDIQPKFRSETACHTSPGRGVTVVSNNFTSLLCLFPF